MFQNRLKGFRQVIKQDLTGFVNLLGLKAAHSDQRLSGLEPLSRFQFRILADQLISSHVINL